MTSNRLEGGTTMAGSSSYQNMEKALSMMKGKVTMQEVKCGEMQERKEAPKSTELPSSSQVGDSSEPGQFDDADTKESSAVAEDARKVQGQQAGSEGAGNGSCVKLSPPTGVSPASFVGLDPSASQASYIKPKPELQQLAPSSGNQDAGHPEASPEISNSIEVSEGANSVDVPQTIHAGSMSQASPPSNSLTSAHDTLPSGSSPKVVSTLRRGKWTVEEETYVARVIQDFNSGFLNAPAGTTLRSYLSEKLQCDPMRITKKFTGEACIGKRVFHPAVRSTANTAAIDKAQAELDALERRWRRRLEMQQRESAKKAAASAAASSAVNGTNRAHTMIQGVPVALLSSASQSPGGDGNGQILGRNVVTQAASWLDRANAILKGGHIHNLPNTASLGSSERTDGESINTMPNTEIENQMKEVQRLIYESPHIQQTTAGLPSILTTGQGSSSNFDDSPPSPPEPADKRMRTGSGITGAEDAEALVGFLRSVRASAAAGQDSS